MSTDSNKQDSQNISDTDSKGDLANEVIEQEAGEFTHSDASKLSGASPGDMEENTTPGTPKSISNDR
ncbi:hypothetical protein [Aridibaculum aurantiacum]|uniref:hypothetical protein n=1 Tax=Aridibaculum aurantiacum TaxID=2810307 RepID=UPI001A961A92|nr:hypothetical protein [Aridibaculum aurantiacum]